MNRLNYKSNWQIQTCVKMGNINVSSGRLKRSDREEGHWQPRHAIFAVQGRIILATF